MTSYGKLRERMGLLFFRHLGLAAFMIVAGDTARADYYLHSWENHRTPSKTVELRAESSYYVSTGNFSSDGSFYTPSTLDHYTRIQTDLSLNWGIAHHLTVFGRLGLAQVGVTQPNGLSATTFGFADQTLGLNF